MAYAYAYDNEGKPTQITYPTDASANTPTYNYTYDAMARLSGMTANDGGAGVTNVSYGSANQLLTMNYYGATETRTYNTLLQMTNITATVQGGTGINVNYNFPGGANNGKITSMTDALSGETVTYQYL